MQTEATTELEPGSEGESDSRTAGEILSQERQRLGLNEKEVADQLHITMHYVKALESNSYEKLPGPVFAKGYLKSYALLLGLNEEDLLSRYAEFNSQQQANSEAASRRSKARRNKDRNKPLMIASLVIFVGGFVTLWLANSYFGDNPVGDTTAVSAVNEASNAASAAVDSTSQPESLTQPRLTLESDRQSSPASIDPSSQQSLATAASGEVVELVAAAVPVPDTLGAQSSGAAQSPPQQDIAAVPQPEPVQASDSASSTDRPRVITIDGAGSDVLRLSFSGESWVEVNDSESQQIYRDIREAGDVLEITGSAPFNILLGDAPFTRLSLNGDEIDLTSDIRIDNSARLTVGL